MPTLKILHYKHHKYAAWPHIVYAKQGADEYIAALYWLQTTLKKSQFRINHDKNSFAWFPHSLTYISYHFKHSGDLLAFKLRFNLHVDQCRPN